MQPRTPEDIKSTMVLFALKHPLGVIATSSSANYPSASWVYVFAHDDFTFYIGTRTTTQKFHDIEENSAVSVALADAETLETLQLRGEAEAVADPIQVRQLLESLRETFAKERKGWMSPADRDTHGLFNIDVSRWVPPVSQMREGTYVFYKITPAWARYRRYDADWKEGKDYTEYEVQT
ncbi:MAG: pyridoxamine 5'-phosphate oxidase family protein [Candidatus Pacebacteria bacterium]|nr:pyridoxamine 5'-phosphate oxidase family protein [Candidatus Paceibacterota bacterium]